MDRFVLCGNRNVITRDCVVVYDYEGALVRCETTLSLTSNLPLTSTDILEILQDAPPPGLKFMGLRYRNEWKGNQPP